MHFLSPENYKVLSKIVEQHITKDTGLFEQLFVEFGKKEKGSVMELNKKFLSIISDISTKTHEPRKVSFDQQYNNHRRNFMSYTPKHPESLVFSDIAPKEPLRNIDELIKETVINRQYDLSPVGVSTFPIKEIEPVANTSPAKKYLTIQPATSNEISGSLGDIAIEISSPYTESMNANEIHDMCILLKTLEAKLSGMETDLSILKDHIYKHTIT